MLTRNIDGIDVNPVNTGFRFGYMKPLSKERSSFYIKLSYDVCIGSAR